MGADRVSASARPGIGSQNALFRGLGGRSDRISGAHVGAVSRAASDRIAGAARIGSDSGARVGADLVSAGARAGIGSQNALFRGLGRRSDRIPGDPRGYCFSCGQRPDRRSSPFRIAAAPTWVADPVSAGARPGIGSQNALFRGLGRRSDRIPAPTWGAVSRSAGDRIGFRLPTWGAVSRSAGDRIGFRLPTWVLFLVRPAIGSQEQLVSDRIPSTHVGAVARAVLVPGTDRRTAPTCCGFAGARPRIESHDGAHVGPLRVSAAARPGIGSQNGAHVDAVSPVDRRWVAAPQSPMQTLTLPPVMRPLSRHDHDGPRRLQSNGGHAYRHTPPAVAMQYVSIGQSLSV